MAKKVKFKIVTYDFMIGELEGVEYFVAGRKCFVNRDSVFEYTLTDGETGCRIYWDYSLKNLLIVGEFLLIGLPEYIESRKKTLRKNRIRIPVNK